MGITAKKGSVFWEIFFTIEEEFRVNCMEWDAKLPKNTMRTDEGILTLTPKFMLSHMIIHYGKHMVREGIH